MATTKLPPDPRAPPPEEDEWAWWSSESAHKYEKTMANKFLPFIVEKSTPIHIYQTLLSRSKGMNMKLIATILYLVFKVGLASIRTFVKQQEDLKLEDLYRRIDENYPYEITDDELSIFLGFQRHLPEGFSDSSWIAELNEFETPDILIFLLVLAKLKAKEGEDYLSSVTDLKFDKILEDNSEGLSPILENITEYVQFSDSGSVKTFKDSDDLKSYIFYRAALVCQGKPEEGERIPAIQAVIDGGSSNAPPF